MGRPQPGSLWAGLCDCTGPPNLLAAWGSCQSVGVGVPSPDNPDSHMSASTWKVPWGILKIMPGWASWAGESSISQDPGHFPWYFRLTCIEGSLTQPPALGIKSLS